MMCKPDTQQENMANKEMAQKKNISTKAEYTATMARIDKLMSKGSSNLTKAELQEIRKLALAAESYEHATYEIEMPETLAGMIEMKMYEMKLKQKDLAKKLKISDTKLSLILNGKQRPDVDFLKAVHKELHVDAGFLLKAV